MQKQHKGVQWVVEAVDSGRINPLRPDLSIIPDDILKEIAWEESPEGEIVPKQAAMDVAIFLVVHAKMAETARRNQHIPSHLSLEANEVITGIQCFAMLATLERLKRAGILEYCPSSSEGWVDASGTIKISRLNIEANCSQRARLFDLISNLTNSTEMTTN